MNYPQCHASDRLLFRRPTTADAQAIFDGWSSDKIATQWMGWKRHESIDDTLDFIVQSDRDWEKFGTGPFVMELQSPIANRVPGLHKTENTTQGSPEDYSLETKSIGDGRTPPVLDPVLIGCAGFKFKNPDGSITADASELESGTEVVELGYIFSPQYWGQGYASETLLAMIAYARQAGFKRLVARVHGDNLASDHVLIKHGLSRPEKPLARGSCPNLDSQDYQQLDYELVLK